jgi:hypothetical protein
MKAAEVVDILNKYPSASLVIVINGDGKRSALLGWMPTETCRIRTKRVTQQVADCVVRKHGHQFAVCSTKPHAEKKPTPTIITVTQR